MLTRSGTYHRQHLKRRHHEPERCKRCWVSFNSPKERDAHRQKKTCDEQIKPAGDIFMTTEQVDQLTKCYPRGTAGADAWYHLFKLLVPGMQNYTIQWLRHHLSPCKTPNTLVSARWLRGNGTDRQIPYSVDYHDASARYAAARALMASSNGGLPMPPVPSTSDMSANNTVTWYGAIPACMTYKPLTVCPC